MRIRKEASHGIIEGLLARKGEIRPDRAERDLIWQEDGEKLYITCRACSAINDITTHSIDVNGQLAPCIVCVNCHTHYFVRLANWAGFFSMYCTECNKYKKVKSIEGWKQVSSSACSCCKTYMCPVCVIKKKEERL